MANEKNLKPFKNYQMAQVVPLMGELLSSVTLGLGGLFSTGIQVALLNWQRKAEFTADRAGLLACQNVEAATTVMMKLAGAPPRFYGSLKAEDFKRQAKEFEGFDEDIAEELRARAKDALLTRALASEEELSNTEPADDLLEMDGMDKALAYKLAAKNIITMEDLAEQAVDDLLDIDEINEERAAALIMTARAPWFAEESE